MVDLCAAGHSRLSATIKVGAALNLAPETIRKHYRRMEEAGELPKSLPWEERRAEAIRELLRGGTSLQEATRLEIAALEQEAEALGLNLQGANLGGLIKLLEREMQHLEWLTSSDSPGQICALFQMQGCSDPEEIISRLKQAAQDLPVVRRKVEVVRRLRHLRPETWGT